MTNKKITDLASLASATSDDVLVIVDTATNTTRKITKGDFVSDVTSPPAGTSGQIQFNDSSAFGADSNLFWDNTNKRLGVGTSSPTRRLHIYSTEIENTEFQNPSNAVRLRLSGTAYGNIVNSTGAFYIDNNSSGQKVILRGNAGSEIQNGATIKGSGSTAASTSLLVQNSSGTDLMKVTDDGLLTLRNPANTQYLKVLTSGGGTSIAGYANGTNDHVFQSTLNWTLANFRQRYDGFSFEIGNTPAIDGSAIVNINSTTKGFLPPRMTTTQKNAISSPAAGLQVYDSTTNRAAVYTSAWENVITETNGSPNSVYKLWSGSAAQYAALTPDSSTLYFVI